MHVEDCIDAVLFAGVNDLRKAREAALVPLEAGLFIQERVGVQHDTYTVEAEVCHQLDVFFTEVILFPALPESGLVLRAAELSHHL